MQCRNQIDLAKSLLPLFAYKLVWQTVLDNKLLEKHFPKLVRIACQQILKGVSKLSSVFSDFKFFERLKAFFFTFSESAAPLLRFLGSDANGASSASSTALISSISLSALTGLTSRFNFLLNCPASLPYHYQLVDYRYWAAAIQCQWYHLT